MNDFDKSISKDRLVVVDFYADWCGPCKAVAPRFEALKAKYPTVDFIKINVDHSQDIAQKYKVTAMPTFKLFRKGKLLETVVGADIAKVERLVSSFSAAPSGAGRVLGSGKPAASASNINYSYVAMALFLLYLFFTK